MRSLRVPAIGIAVLVVVALVAGVAIGGGLSGLGPSNTPSATPTTSPVPSSPSSDLPSSDVDGQDLDRMPRYPGSVRSEFGVSDDGSWRTISVEYLVRATLDDVRAFYQGAIVDFGWQRADVAFAGGEWTYVLVDGRIEVVVEIEQVGDLVEIDLLHGQPIETPTMRPAPTMRPPPPPPGDDDDDDDDDDSDDGDSDDGSGDD